jgi:hypothetical protein
MDITTVSGASAFTQQNIASNVSTSVAAKVLDSERTQGAGALQLLQASTIPAQSTDGHVDVKA